jgi:hypothetical protein
MVIAAMHAKRPPLALGAQVETPMQERCEYYS